MKYRNKTRTTSFENEQLKITIEEKEMDSSVRHLTPVKSEYIVSGKKFTFYLPKFYEQVLRLRSLFYRLRIIRGICS